MKIVIAEFMDEAAVSTLRSRFDVVYDPALVDRRAELLKLLGDAPALIVRNRTRVDAEMLAAAPKLRVVGRLGVGLDNIDVAACKARGIEVIPATGANALAVAEYVIASVMVLLRGAYLSSAEVAGGKWPRTRLSEGRETAGRTLGLVGFGGIGRHAVSDCVLQAEIELSGCVPLIRGALPPVRSQRRVARDTEPRRVHPGQCILRAGMPPGRRGCHPVHGGNQVLLDIFLASGRVQARETELRLRIPAMGAHVQHADQIAARCATGAQIGKRRPRQWRRQQGLNVRCRTGVLGRFCVGERRTHHEQESREHQAPRQLAVPHPATAQENREFPDRHR